MRCVINDEECAPGRLKRGMCSKHYQRLRLTGSTASTRIDNLSNYEVMPNGCWRWKGAVWSNGYGKTSIKIHGTRLAHRGFYIEHVGPIPDGLDLDHRCHNDDPDCDKWPDCEHRQCVNPADLEPASRSTNLTRAIAARKTCEAGLHDLTAPGAVRNGNRQCVECWRTRYRTAGKKYRAKQKLHRQV